MQKIVEEVIKEIGAKSLADMGKVIKAVLAKVGEQAEGGRISKIVKTKLAA